MLDMFALNWGNNPQDTVSSIQYQPAVAGAQHVAALREVHEIIAPPPRLRPRRQRAFEEWDSIQSQQMVGKIFDAMDIFLGGVGLVTLALGAVGIVNIMLVSVTERTREIGLRKALGATERSILVQFFLEGLTFTGVSGFIGIGRLRMFSCGYCKRAIGKTCRDSIRPGSALVRRSGHGRAEPSAASSAGLYPASPGRSLEPVEALRRE